MHIRHHGVEGFAVESKRIEAGLYDRAAVDRLESDLVRKNRFDVDTAKRLAVSMLGAIWHQHSTFRDGSAAEAVLEVLRANSADIRICNAEYLAEMVDLLHTTLQKEERLAFLSLLNSELGRGERAEVYPRFIAWARAHALIPDGMEDRAWWK